MLVYTKGNIFEAKTQAITNTVNTVGVMGKGLALEFKNRYPLNYDLYCKACSKGEVKVGEMFITRTGKGMYPQFIVNFPTKQHWRDSSKLEWIELGLINLVQQLKDLNIKSIAIPPLGCGLGGLDWFDVRILLSNYLAGIKTGVVIYEPS